MILLSLFIFESSIIIGIYTQKGEKQINPNFEFCSKNNLTFGQQRNLTLKDIDIIGILNPFNSSMQPLINGGETLLYIDYTDKSQLKVCDIIDFYYVWSDNSINDVTHRIIEINDEYVVTRGDNVPFDKVEKVSYKNIKGILVGVLK